MPYTAPSIAILLLSLAAAGIVLGILGIVVAVVGPMGSVLSTGGLRSRFYDGGGAAERGAG